MLDVEIAEIWSHKFTGASFLFVLHEYSTLAYQVFVVVLTFYQPRLDWVRCPVFIV